MDLSVSWSLTICYHCRQERRACAQYCVVERIGPSTSVVRRRTSETHCYELRRNKHKQAVNDHVTLLHTEQTHSILQTMN